MDHIWGAPSGFKKSLALIFLEKSVIILRQDFLKTPYVSATLTPGLVGSRSIKMGKHRGELIVRRFLSHKYREQLKTY